MKRAPSLMTGAVVALALLAPHDARAACTEAGACATTQYCAEPDGGAVTDGGAGTCLAEPCVVKSDCTGSALCDTSVEPHRCVQCVSTADCLAPLVCDLPTHTCVVPAGFDAGTDAGSDAGPKDAGAVDAAPDASTPVTPPPPHDAGDAAVVAVEDAGRPDLGALSGGACDCDLATRDGVAPGAVASSIAVALLWIARRSRRRRGD